MKIEFIFLIDWITIHFGKNPRKGGSPPNDSNEMNKLNLTKGFWLKKENIWFKWKNLNKLKMKINVKDK